MIIKKVAVGNSEEAYIEKKLSSGFNIISSDDNNRGKTIIIQSMMYALGNHPIFPQSFNYNEYYHYIEFCVNNKNFCLCRFKNIFILRDNGLIRVFDNLSEFKRYWDTNIFTLPRIIKDDKTKVVDFELYCQIFFVGQDKKTTDNIVNAGYYKKIDFINMIYSLLDAGSVVKSNDVEKLKKELITLKDRKTLLLKQNKILKSSKLGLQYISNINDKIEFENKINIVNVLKNDITDLRKIRNRYLNLKIKWEGVLKELNSLNKTIDTCELRCMDCNSTNISLNLKGNKHNLFDVSTVEMRSEIIESIEYKISDYVDEINKLTSDINSKQTELNNVLKEDDISIENIVMYKSNILSIENVTKEISEINDKIEDITYQINQCKNVTLENKELQNKINQDIEKYMNQFYKHIDTNGNMNIACLFSKNGTAYSGSESTIFFLTKILALHKLLNHSNPIIIDSFRAEDLSTFKEKIVIDLFKKIDNQIIFTTTLKEEEIGKYKNIVEINNIDYCNHLPSKILNQNDVYEFKNLLKNLAIDI